ncbi:hypothetical protein K2173_018531 [Erythroxylum novogranatense]|uniref:AB hydrolase-1 domain-containing protein n=1 Tax=Erythroxylum novogranatense TaxID=1862640 RepID=A0AAV8UEC2_9ROSI|nr:hypothetical protein K2173_018531 [Erythroxylum novogranatense]
MASLRKAHSSSLILRRFLNSGTGSPSVLSYTTTRTLETLAYEEVRASSDKPFTNTAFILHGLLGSARNWRSFSRSLASTLSSSDPSSEWRMVLVDLRNHGESAKIEGLHFPHNMFNAAKDLSNLVTAHGWPWPDVVIGHSMGGKVALQFAQSCARGDYGQSVVFPKQLWVLDSVPGEVSTENSDGEVEKVLKTLQSLPSTVPSRRWLVNRMIELGFSKSLSGWMGSNLKKHEEQETWAFNLDGAIQMFNSYRETSYWSLLEHPPKGMEIGMVVAEKSDRWNADIIHQLERLAGRRGNGSEGEVSLYVLPNSGHWVHVDNPKGLLKILAPKLSSLST